MVDPIAPRPVSTSDGRIAPVARVAAAAVPERPAPRPDAGVVAVAHALAVQPPVDADRVARLRGAIAEGRYRISPAQIADRLIAFDKEWQA